MKCQKCWINEAVEGGFRCQECLYKLSDLCSCLNKGEVKDGIHKISSRQRD